MKSSNSIWGKIFLFITLLSGIAFFWNLSRHQREVEEITQNAINQSIAETDAVTHRVEYEIQLLEKIGNQLLGAGLHTQPPEKQLATINETLAQYEEIFGIGIIYNHNKIVNRPDIYGSRRDPTVILLSTDSLLHKEEKEWFQEFIKNGQKWSDSLVAKGKNRNPRIQIGLPIGDKVDPDGALFIHLSIRELQKILSSAQLGKGGYGFLLSESGKFIYHPVNEWAVGGKSIFEVGYQPFNAEIEASLNAAKLGETKLLQFSNPLNGLESWYFFEPVGGANWVVGVTFFKEEMVNNFVNRRQSRIILSVWLVLCLSALVLSFRLLFPSLIHQYVSVGVISLCLFLGIAYIIIRSFGQPILMPFDWESDDIKVTELPVLKHFQEVQDSIYNQFYESPPVYVKTGIYVEQARFDDPHQIMVSGYIWQEYDLDHHKDISRGFVFPETDPNAEYLDIEEAYHEIVGNKEIIGWNFRVALRKKFNYSHYPFDWQNIRIKLWHPDFLKNVILIPDLESYKLLNPSSLAGVKSKFEMPGWIVRESYFSFKNSSFNTNFGIRPSAGVNRHPELCFNVYIKRVFLSPFVSNVFTITIIIILLFGAQILELKKASASNKRVIVGSLGIIELSAAFFFVLMIAHTSLRDSLSVEELIYIDYFYFACYFMILLTCLNFVMADDDDESENMQKLIPKQWLKILYWPILFAIFFIVTVLVFF